MYKWVWIFLKIRIFVICKKLCTYLLHLYKPRSRSQAKKQLKWRNVILSSFGRVSFHKVYKNWCKLTPKKCYYQVSLSNKLCSFGYAGTKSPLTTNQQTSSGWVLPVVRAIHFDMKKTKNRLRERTPEEGGRRKNLEYIQLMTNLIITLVIIFNKANQINQINISL